MAETTTTATPMDVEAASPAQDEKPLKEVGKSPANAPTSTPRARRARKQAEFFTPDPIGAAVPDKLVVKEVSTGCFPDSGIRVVTRAAKVCVDPISQTELACAGQGYEIGRNTKR